MHIDPYIVLGSAIIGLLVGMTGAGGGALMTPMLILLFGVTPSAAISSDLVAAVVMRPFGAGVHLRAGTVNLRLVRWMVLGSVPSAFLGAYLLHVLGNSKSATQHIETVLGVALLLGAAAMALRFVLDRRSGQNRLGVVHDLRPRPLATIAIGIVGGVIVGMTSVGSGSLMIVLLLFVYPTIGANQLVGTDLTQAVPLTLAAAIGALIFGHVVLDVTGSLIIGSVPAVLVGSMLSSTIPDRYVRPAIAFVIFASGLKYVGLQTTALGWTLCGLLFVAGATWLTVARPWRVRSSSVIERLDVPVAGGTLGAYRLARGRDPVLAVHGITANSRAWLAVARELEGRAELLAVDLRGRAASSALPPPYGMEAYTRDLLAVLDACGLERAVLVGHSLGAFAVARFAADHPERVRAAVLIDGGLTSPAIQNVDPEALLGAFLGPALARLELTFETHEAYHDWWRAHPAFAGADVADSDLTAYADHDLGGEAPELRPTVAKEAVRTDAHELFELGKPAHRLTVPVEMLRAPRGLQNDPTPLIAPELAAAWADEAPDQRRVIEVPDINHYTLVMGQAGARTVAQAIVRAMQAPADDPALRSAR